MECVAIVQPASVSVLSYAAPSPGSSLIIFSSFLFFRFLVKNDSLGNFDFVRQRHLDYGSNFEGLAKNDLFDLGIDQDGQSRVLTSAVMDWL